MAKTILTYEELYRELFSRDKEHRMYKKDNTCFCIRLDEEYDITVFDNGRGEVYLEYNEKGKQLTHYHPDYQEAYEDLIDVIQNTEIELERLKRNAETSRKACRVAIIIVMLIILFCGVIRLFC